MAIESLDAIERPNDRIIVALDYDNWISARKFLFNYGADIGLAKIHSFADEYGIGPAVASFRDLKSLTMLDYKLHDTPETMLLRSQKIAAAGPAIITAHASAGFEGLTHAMHGIDKACEENPKLSLPWLFGVTVLTSQNEMTCESIFHTRRKQKVMEFAHVAVDACIHGIVCAADEAEMIKNDDYTKDLKIIVPAVRPIYATKKDNQAMIATPARAMEAGADFIVVGRPITEAQQYGMSVEEAIEFIAEDMVV